MLAAPSAAVVGFVMNHRRAGPDIPVAVAKIDACNGVIARLTSGRPLVLAICISNGTSCNWFNVLADAEHNAVPIAAESRTGTVTGRGDSATLDMAVRVMRTVRRDLDNWE